MKDNEGNAITMSEEVRFQVAAANNILDKIEIISPYAILAGGAPRDWYFGNKANDLDFYFTSSSSTLRAVEKQLETQFGDIKLQYSNVNESPIYKHMKFLKRIITTEIHGIPVQFMQLNDISDTFKVVDAMSVSICKAWYKGYTLHTTRDFKITEASKIMFLSDGYSWCDPHPKKMHERFPDYGMGAEEHALNSIVNKVLKE